jgi:hemoglobin-like flavoprotein
VSHTIDNDVTQKSDLCVLFLFYHSIELLGEILVELGEKHVRFGVQAEMFPLMGDALIHTLQECLGDSFNNEIEECWHQVYHEISQDMLRGMTKKK